MELRETYHPPVGGSPVLARFALPAPHSYSLEFADFAAFSRTGGARSCDTAPGREKHDVSSRFGRRLRELRLERRLTQSDMAKKFGIDRSFISDVERGRKSISLPLLEVIAIGLQISLSTLFEGI